MADSDVVIANGTYQSVTLQPHNAAGTQLFAIKTASPGRFYVFGARTTSTYDPLPSAWQGVEVYEVDYYCEEPAFGGGDRGDDHRHDRQPGERRDRLEDLDERVERRVGGGREAAIGEWFTCSAPVRRGPNGRPHWHVGRDGVKAGLVDAAPHVSVPRHEVAKVPGPPGRQGVEAKGSVGVRSRPVDRFELLDERIPGLDTRASFRPLLFSASAPFGKLSPERFHFVGPLAQGSGEFRHPLLPLRQLLFEGFDIRVCHPRHPCGCQT